MQLKRYGKSFKTIALFMAVLISVLFLGAPIDQAPATAEAKSVSDYREDISKLDNQIADLQSKIDSNKTALKDEQARKEQLEEQILNIEAQIALYQTKIDALNAEIEDYEEKIAAQELEIEKNQEIFEGKLRRMYISSMSSSTFSALFTSESFADFLSRNEILKRISQQDQEAIKNLRESVEEFERLKAELDVQMKDLEETRAQIEAKYDEVNELYEDSLANESAILAANKQYAQNIEKYKAQQEAYEQEIRDLLAAEGSDTAYGDGKFKWPVPYYSRISSYFGWRTLYGKPNYHTGIDIPAPTGTKIIASDAGKVITVKDLGKIGAGLHLVIDHGNGYSTLYAHTSKILVKQGQMVSKGQAIAEVGSTGNSTGPHLHFEIRINGVYQNPINYVKYS